MSSSLKTPQKDKKVQKGTTSSSKERSVDDSETDTTDSAPSDDSAAEDEDSDAEDEDSDAEYDDSDAEDDDSDAEDDDGDAEDDDSDIAGDDSPPETPCPTCRRRGRGLTAENQSPSHSTSPGDLLDPTETDITLGLSSLSLESSADSNLLSINFRQFNKVSLERWLVVLKVFHTILDKKLKRGGDGYIYILEDKNQPGYLKIGRTTAYPHDRSRQIQRCKVVHPELVKGQKFTTVQCHKLLERIIFADLWNERQRFDCSKCGKKHEEWFKMSKEEALLRVKLWQKWMQREPYDSQGVLKHEWQKRIEAFKGDPSLEETVEAEHASGKWWQTFTKEF